MHALTRQQSREITCNDVAVEMYHLCLVLMRVLSLGKKNMIGFVSSCRTLSILISEDCPIKCLSLHLGREGNVWDRKRDVELGGAFGGEGMRESR